MGAGLVGGSIIVGAVILGTAISSGLERIAFRLHEVAKAIEEKNKEEEVNLEEKMLRNVD